MSESAPQGDGLKNCDVVMKGGITSGIVYPPAVLKLSRTYRFCGIGGTSAGAIAAAATAAAELARDTGGFERLRQMSEQLSASGKLSSLFQPTPQAKSLFDLALGLVGSSTKPEAGPSRATSGLGSAIAAARRVSSALDRSDAGPLQSAMLLGTRWGAGAALAFAAGLLGLLALLGTPPAALGLLGALFLVLTVMLGWVGSRVGGVAHLAEVAAGLPSTGFGLCPGPTQSNDPSRPRALIDWLDAELSRIAFAEPEPGRAPILTFGALRDATSRQNREPAEELRLFMISTDLSEGVPVRFPDQLGGLLFHEDELRRYLPERVVQHLIAHAPHSDPTHPVATLALPELSKYHFLPPADDLPVVVGVRFSLSFPLLFTAVPLYRIESDAITEAHEQAGPRILGENDLRRLWFSDGGIVSNFPIHFFDNWLPRWPTFGITLGELPVRAFEPAGGPGLDGAVIRLRPGYRSVPSNILPGAAVQRGAAPGVPAVHLPRPDESVALDWFPLENWGQFASSILATAQSNREVLQSTLPGYRERIVEIRLAKTEGGLNLNMSPATIQTLLDRGEEAGTTLVGQFQFGHHRWVRLLTLLAELECNLGKADAVYGTQGFEPLIETASKPASEFPYNHHPAGWADHVIAAIRDLRGLIAQHAGSPLATSGEFPTPMPQLKMTYRDLVQDPEDAR
jgi:predicted acylesterase/phospholipase RssA